MPASTPHAAERLVIADDFIHAVAAADWDRADRLYPELSGMLTEACLKSLATLHMQRERWSDAADALDRVKDRDPERSLHRNLCRNLASLKQHRPEIYRVIAGADVADAYRVHATPKGITTIATMRDGKLVLLSGGDDPVAGGVKLCEQLKPQFQSGAAIALLSIGDGYALRAITEASKPLFLGRRQLIVLIEPDPRLVLACMLIHDLTGPDGPIERDHVMWYVGEHWAEQFKLAMLTDRYLAFPQVTIKAGLDPKPLEAVLQQTLETLLKHDAAANQDIQRHYGQLDADHFAQAIAGKLSRAPRALLVTTRFSTVLQYSTCDTADALRQLGWEAQVLIEPSTHHALTRVGMRRTLAEFKPDLIFQIDHNRFEHGDLFPSNIPFVNWIQDLLPHLMTDQTGRKLTQRDFVLTPSLQRWVNDYAYPARQCLEFRKLTRLPTRPISWKSRGNQVAYVSNWSQKPEQIRDELTRGATGKAREVFDLACERMIAIYMSGAALPTQGDVRRLLIDVMRQLEVAGDESLIRQTTTRLFDRMNNLLFRQQGLRWARRACESLGLELQIFGNGWDANPEFAAFAQGPIGYGEALEELTRAAGINLVLEPFVSIAHQRLLDALAAGGFCLIRHNPANATIRSLIDLLSGVDDTVHTRDQLHAALDDASRQQLNQTLVACDALDAAPGAVDHVAIVRSLQQGGFLPKSGELLPLLDQVVFDSADGLQQHLQRFSRDDILRSDIARKQRHTIEKRYSYVAGMKTMTHFLAERLASEPKQIGKAA